MSDKNYKQILKLGICIIIISINCQSYSTPPVLAPLDEDDIRLNAELKALRLDRYSGIKYTRHESNWNDPFWEMYYYHPDECKCILGSEYLVASSRVRRSKNVVFFLEGGGACWPGEDDCTKKVNPDEVLDGRRIIPLGTWNHIYVPYCDGSVHMGDNEEDRDGDGNPDYWHWGLRTTSAAVALMQELYPNPEKILVAGTSAGGYGTIIATMVIRLHFPRAKLYVLNNSGPGLRNPGDDETWEKIEKAWNIHQFFPSDCDKCDDQLIYLYDWMLERDDKLKIGIVTSYEDQTISDSFLRMKPRDFKNLLLRTTDSIRQRHPDTFKRFFIEGNMHGIPNTYNIRGVTLGKWLKFFVSDSENWADILE
jgi:hypothetical protein